MNHAARVALYDQIEKERDTKVLAFVTSERPNWQTQIAADAVAPFVALLDQIGPTKKVSLILHTHGGSISAAWRLINLVRSFADDVEVIVPDIAMSAGTLMALGADRILMTKQAALGPIDPSLDNHPLAPTFFPAGPAGPMLRLSVSAEAVRGYIEEVKKDVTDSESLAKIWSELSEKVHPLVLGDIFRMGNQIRALAKDLIQNQVKDQETRDNIIQYLCADSGSHDHTINRRKARALGLNVETPSAALYQILSDITKSYHDELETFVPYSPDAVLQGQNQAQYTLIRGLIESTAGGSYGYVSEGLLTNQAAAGQPANLTDQRTFEGWRLLP